MENKLFTVHEANELLPQLKEDLQALRTLADEMEDQYIELQKLKVKHEQSTVPKNAVKDPFFEAEGRLEFMRVEADLLIENFTRKGVLLKMINPGLIDFPTIIDGKDVLICWKEGEERITHYHGWHDGFNGRRPLPDAE
ncbi:hypothetical protein Back11_58310 [Paenibacillus baekrokdamisoli]|uniref:Uncharacterized protein n=1 Tax=Paenibacillus baekrokdamisoli TaxID=1712516 RepID=A0A3G9J149_9BACL|nr:DUF2203 domain-containing protein [Paenibacillus baekrokdamisoli]MBB3071483.1 hypothetical protein [Paenibacillus baekrokdamisoli]BBH24486.1 hypothetical protein Back11_58310 [Paenibacillus baekrokdamisoli]